MLDLSLSQPMQQLKILLFDAFDRYRMQARSLCGFTPTIIFAGEKDERVPPTQSIILFRALRDLGVESKFYLAPREPHGFKKFRHRLFKINAELGWFEKYVNGRDYRWESAPE